MDVEVPTQPLAVGGRVIATDHLGYLLDPAAWDPAVAEALAVREGLTLESEHPAVIDLARAHYERCQAVPEARTLLKEMRDVLGEERASRRYPHRLFPYGYGCQVCKIAGMTMPRKVMLNSEAGPVADLAPAPRFKALRAAWVELAILPRQPGRPPQGRLDRCAGCGPAIHGSHLTPDPRLHADPLAAKRRAGLSLRGRFDPARRATPPSC